MRNRITKDGVRLTSLERRLGVYKDEVVVRVRRALLSGAERVAMSAKANVNSDTGNLFRKIKASQTKKSGETYVRSNALYSKSVEYGHELSGAFAGSGGGRVPPHPFLFTAFKQHERSIRHDVIRAVLGAKAKL